jgi:hypothetical protein
MEPLLLPILPLPQIEDPCKGCGKESEYGAHGIRDQEVYDEYWCGPCYHKKDV